MFGNSAPTLQKLARRVLSQTASSSACERNWSTFALIHTKLRNRLAYNKLEKLVFCSYNMKLMLRDRQAEMENVVAQDPLDMIQKSLEIVCQGQQDDDDEMLNWIRPTHLDDDALNPDPAIAAEARRDGVDVDRVLSEEVHSSSHSHHSPSESGDDHGFGGSGELQHGSGSGRGEGDGGSQHGDGGGEGYTHAEPDDFFNQMLHDFPDRGYDGSYNRQQQMSDGMSFSGSNDVDQLSQYFGSMSFTPESSEASFPFGSTQHSYGSYLGYPPPPPPPPLLDVLIPVTERRTYTGLDGQPIHIQAQPGFPIFSIYVGLDQYNYDTHVRTYMSTFSANMTWYEYCQLQNQQPQTFVPPRHSSFY